ncbi:MAG: YbjN domain-containing protein [Gammaproteobacteria bacterium]|nr:YbjN domain-containing protein [Gammaproteobacteria bacterium]
MNTLTAFIAALLLFGVVPTALAGESAYASLSTAQTNQLLSRLGHASTPFDLGDGQTVHVLDFGGTKAVLRPLDCRNDVCHALRLNATYRFTRVELDALNRWNAALTRERAYPAKAFLDHDGHVQLVADLDLEGGVQDGDLAAFVSEFAAQATHLEQALH